MFAYVVVLVIIIYKRRGKGGGGVFCNVGIVLTWGCNARKHCTPSHSSCHRTDAATVCRLLCHHTDMRWRSWLRHCAANRKVVVSIPGGANGICNSYNPSGLTMAL